MSKTSTSDTAIALIAVSGHKVDDETRQMLKEIDAGTLTYEEAIQLIHKACIQLPKKVIRTKQDIQEFYED
jgi:hypothetical protein